MSTKDFVCAAILLPDKFCDELLDNFDIEYSTDDVCDALTECARCNSQEFGKAVALMVIHKVEDKLKKDFPSFDTDKFDWLINGGDSHLYYDRQEFCDMESFENAFNKPYLTNVNT